MGERIPQSVQNLVLRNYCKNNNLVFELSSTEYAMNESFYILNQLLVNKKYKSIIFYSLFQLPENNILRYEILSNSTTLPCLVSLAKYLMNTPLV